jgi:thiol-disulfide isomerase/thioredoxin
MQKIFLVVFVIMLICYNAASQNAPQLTENSIVKDTSGNTIPYSIWTRLLLTGRYKIKNEKKEDVEFIIVRLTDEEYEKVLEKLPKPNESKYFRTGANFSHFKTTDINGNKINTKNLTGKIIVLNFWFINCPPCIMEMPELTKLSDTYKDDSSIVFFAIALDRKSEIEQFLKNSRFGYTIIDDGRFISNQYGIISYPTNVIIDQKGKVYFHTTGLSTSTVHWLKKSIEELKKPEDKKDATAKSD